MSGGHGRKLVRATYAAKYAPIIPTIMLEQIRLNRMAVRKRERYSIRRVTESKATFETRRLGRGVARAVARHGRSLDGPGLTVRLIRL